VNTKTITLTPDQVRAALAGRLEQVRMPIAKIRGFKKVLHFQQSTTPGYDWQFRCEQGLWQDFRNAKLIDRCPWGVAGDRLYVQEQIYYSVEHDNFYYSCDGKGLGQENYLRLRELEFDQKESIDVDSLPEWASRLTFDITGIRVERDNAGVWCWVVDVRKVGE
jgi:hypothetical protein